jgi:hypothetical protein
MNYFSPHDDLSQTLLKSIPKKVFYWLNNLGEDLSQEGQYGPLKWNFSPECGEITHYDINDDSMISISWVGSTLEIQEIQGNDPRFCEIINHLEWFTRVEQLVYGTLEDLSSNSLSSTDFSHQENQADGE